MLYVLLILVIIACALLVLIILAQNPKGGGISNIGAGASQILGARQTADFLEKSTWYFGIGIMVVVVFSFFLMGNPAQTGAKLKVEETGNFLPSGFGQTAPVPGANTPAGGAQTPAAPEAQPTPQGNPGPAAPAQP